MRCCNGARRPSVLTAKLRISCSRGLRTIPTRVRLLALRSTASPIALRSGEYESRRLGEAVLCQTMASFQPRLIASCIPVFIPLAAGGTVDVGGIARDKHAASSIILHLALVDTKAADPHRIVWAQIGNPRAAMTS